MVLNKSTQFQARKFLAPAKEPAIRSYPVLSNLKVTVDEGKQKLASSLEGKVLGVYARCVYTSWIIPTDLSSSTKREYELKDPLIKFMLYAQRDQTEVDDDGVKQSSISKPTASAIYRKAQLNLASSRELLGHYERASQQVAFSKGVSMMESGWEKDNQTLQRILDRQKERTKLEVHQHLNKHLKSSTAQIEGDASKSDADIWDHFAVSDDRNESVKALDTRKRETWAVVAKNAQRGVRRVVKDLPEGHE